MASTGDTEIYKNRDGILEIKMEEEVSGVGTGNESRNITLKQDLCEGMEAKQNTLAD